jgi:hypothetical protein
MCGGEVATTALPAWKDAFMALSVLDTVISVDDIQDFVFEIC